jgi:hypothetical protein
MDEDLAVLKPYRGDLVVDFLKKKIRRHDKKVQVRYKPAGRNRVCHLLPQYHG